MAGAGSVAWIFEKKGLLVVPDKNISEDALMELVLAAGAEDLAHAGDKFEITTSPHDFETVRTALEKAKISSESAQITMIPKNLIAVSSENARALLKMMDGLEEHDDVQNVYVNCDMPEEIMKEIG